MGGVAGAEGIAGICGSVGINGPDLGGGIDPGTTMLGSRDSEARGETMCCPHFGQGPATPARCAGTVSQDLQWLQANWITLGFIEEGAAFCE